MSNNNKPYKALDQNTTNRLLEAIRLGAFTEHACHFAGISSRTFRYWREKASNDIEPYKSLWEQITLAESEAIVRRVARIEQAGADGNWQADAWVLERKYPDKFGRRDKVTLEADPNAPIEVELQWADGNVLDRDQNKEIVIDMIGEEE